MNSLKDCFMLSNGVKIPCVGFGTYLAKGDEAKNSTKIALECGYRHIDTAAVYKNEKEIGEAIKESNIARDEIFVTSKLWNTERGYDKTMKVFQKTIDNLGLDYLDLYLIHWPANAKYDENWEETNISTWRAFEELYKQGKIKSVGVSNFMPHHLKSLMSRADIMPMVNQIEYHIGFMQHETINFCKENNIVAEGWSPLGRGEALTNKNIVKLSQKYNVTPAQLILCWCLQNNVIPLPKSVTQSRIIENSKCFGFDISNEDIEIINKETYDGAVGVNPDEVNF